VKGSAVSPSVVVVKFVRRCQRDMVYMARKKLFTPGNEVRHKIFINEDLSPDVRKLLGSLRHMVRNGTLSGAWSNFGKIYAKKLDGTVIHITKLSDLHTT
jgi:hypothetical protein